MNSICFNHIVLLFILIFISPSATVSVSDNSTMDALFSAVTPTPSGWSSATHFCDWRGVECDGKNRVIVINLLSQSLSGTLPASLNSLTRLAVLSLQNNQFSGPLPSFANLFRLRKLYLDNNSFNSIPTGAFSGLISLQILCLSNNANLSAWHFPSDLANSPKMVALQASNANIVGSIPDIFRSFPRLVNLSLSYNNLTGSLPGSFNGSAIQELKLDNQKPGLTGNIDLLSGMYHLSVVWLNGNKFTGVVPPSFVSLPNLTDVRLERNNFIGPIPDLSKNASLSRNDNVVGSFNCRRCKVYIRANVGNLSVVPPEANSSLGKKTNVGKIVGFTFVVVFVILVLFVCICWKRRSASEDSSYEQQVEAVTIRQQEQRGNGVNEGNGMLSNTDGDGFTRRLTEKLSPPPSTSSSSSPPPPPPLLKCQLRQDEVMRNGKEKQVQQQQVPVQQGKQREENEIVSIKQEERNKDADDDVCGVIWQFWQDIPSLTPQGQPSQDTITSRREGKQQQQQQQPPQDEVMRHREGGQPSSSSSAPPQRQLPQDEIMINWQGDQPSSSSSSSPPPRELPQDAIIINRQGDQPSSSSSKFSSPPPRELPQDEIMINRQGDQPSSSPPPRELPQDEIVIHGEDKQPQQQQVDMHEGIQKEENLQPGEPVEQQEVRIDVDENVYRFKWLWDKFVPPPPPLPPPPLPQLRRQEQPPQDKATSRSEGEQPLPPPPPLQCQLPQDEVVGRREGNQPQQKEVDVRNGIPREENLNRVVSVKQQEVIIDVDENGYGLKWLWEKLVPPPPPPPPPPPRQKPPQDIVTRRVEWKQQQQQPPRDKVIGHREGEQPSSSSPPLQGQISQDEVMRLRERKHPQQHQGAVHERIQREEKLHQIVYVKQEQGKVDDNEFMWLWEKFVPPLSPPPPPLPQLQQEQPHEDRVMRCNEGEQPLPPSPPPQQVPQEEVMREKKGKQAQQQPPQERVMRERKGKQAQQQPPQDEVMRERKGKQPQQQPPQERVMRERKGKQAQQQPPQDEVMRERERKGKQPQHQPPQDKLMGERKGKQPQQQPPQEEVMRERKGKQPQDEVMRERKGKQAQQQPPQDEVMRERKGKQPQHQPPQDKLMGERKGKQPQQQPPQDEVMRERKGKQPHDEVMRERKGKQPRHQSPQDEQVAKRLKRDGELQQRPRDEDVERKYKKGKDRTELYEPAAIQRVNSLGLRNKYSYRYLKWVTSNFSPGKLIGKGGFGTVFKGTLPDGTILFAVKRLKVEGRIDDFKNEVDALVKADHPNLVTLLGYCVGDSAKFLVYEYMKNGSLDEWIFYPNSTKSLTWPEKKNIIQGIARGLVYLHDDSHKKILHRDLKPQNIVLDENKNAKLCDFGLAKLLDKDQSCASATLVGTLRYMAPEIAKLHIISEKADVYSFGIVVLEVLFEKLYRNLVRYGYTNVEVHQLPELIKKNVSEKMQENAYEIEEIGRLAVECLQENPNYRPTMSYIVTSIQLLDLKIQEPKPRRN